MDFEKNLFVPVDLEHSRSTYDFEFYREGTCMAGRLIPTLAMEILPGDSWRGDLSTLFKMSTPVYPTMDNLFADVFFFYVPYKLLLSRRYGSPSVNDGNQSWKAIIGAQDNLLNMPIPQTGLQVPGVTANGGRVGSLSDYFNLNLGGTNGFSASCFPYLAYYSIWNENFRDPNTMTPVTWNYNSANNCIFNGHASLLINKFEDIASQVPSGQNYAWVNALDVSTNSPVTGQTSGQAWPMPVCRFHDYFGSALPWPQRNTDGVDLPLGDAAPVVTGPGMMKTDGSSDYLSTDPLRFVGVSGSTFSTLPADSLIGNFGANYQAGATGTSTYSANVTSIVPENLYADLSEATAANVNALRMAIQQQRWYEKLARSGNRYDELKYGLFGVRGKDAGDDRPLYLGGKRIPLSIEMVASTQGGTNPSVAEGASSLGSLGAFSHTNDTDHYFYHSFDDWGVLMCLFTIRHCTTVNGFHKRMWDRRTRDDFYFPTFAHLGEQAISREELTGDPTDKATVFGYQQAWEEHRFEPNMVSGLLRPGKSLGFMTYSEQFVAPTLNGFLNASSMMRTVDQTLAVASYTSGFQFVYQFNFHLTGRRCVPVYSIPGLMDHF